VTSKFFELVLTLALSWPMITANGCSYRAAHPGHIAGGPASDASMRQRLPSPVGASVTSLAKTSDPASLPVTPVTITRRATRKRSAGRTIAKGHLR